EESTHDGLIDAPPAEVFGILDPWVTDRLTPQPLRTWTEPLALASDPPLPRLYVRCTHGPLTASFSGFANRFRDAAHWDVVDFASAHDAMLLPPLALAVLLVT